MGTLRTSLAKIDHAGLANAGCIVENILEAQGVGGRRVFIDERRVDDGCVVSRRIAYQAEVGVGGNATVGGVEAASGSYSCRVGAVGLHVAVIGATQLEQSLLASIIAADIVGRSDGVRRQMVPQGLDTITVHVARIKGGVSQVETDVLHADDHTLARESLRQIASLIGWNRIDNGARSVHRDGAGAVGFYSHHSSVKRQSPDMAQGDGDDMEGRSETRQALHTIALKELIGVTLSTDEGRQFASFHVAKLWALA